MVILGDWHNGLTRRNRFCEIHPRDKPQGAGGANRNAFRIPVAEEALAGFCRCLIENNHFPGASALTGPASPALFLIDDPSSRFRISHDGLVGTRGGAGHRVRALQTHILNQPEIAELAHAPVEPGLLSLGAEVVVARDLHARHRWLRMPVVEFRARQLAELAADTARGVGHQHSFGIFQNDALRLGQNGIPNPANRQSCTRAQRSFYKASPSSSIYVFSHAASFLQEIQAFTSAFRLLMRPPSSLLA
jgi:hypothetical protein